MIDWFFPFSCRPFTKLDVMYVWPLVCLVLARAEAYGKIGTFGMHEFSSFRSCLTPLGTDASCERGNLENFMTTRINQSKPKWLVRSFFFRISFSLSGRRVVLLTGEGARRTYPEPVLQLHCEAGWRKFCRSTHATSSNGTSYRQSTRQKNQQFDCIPWFSRKWQERVFCKLSLLASISRISSTAVSARRVYRSHHFNINLQLGDDGNCSQRFWSSYFVRGS